MQRNDLVRSQGHVICNALDVERKLFVVADRNLDPPFPSGRTNASRRNHDANLIFNVRLDLGEIEEDSYRFVRGSDVDHAWKFRSFDRVGAAIDVEGARDIATVGGGLVYAADVVHDLWDVAGIEEFRAGQMLVALLDHGIDDSHRDMDDLGRALGMFAVHCKRAVKPV